VKRRIPWIVLGLIVALAFTLVWAQERPRRVLSFVGKPGELAENCDERRYPDSYLIKEEAEFWECDSAAGEWAQIEVQSPSVPSAHASTHQTGGADATFDGLTIGDGTAEDLALTFDLDADQTIAWDEAAGLGDGFAVSDSIVQLDGGSQDAAFLEVRDSGGVFSAPIGQLDWIESNNTFHIYALDILKIGTEDPDVAASSSNPYLQITRSSNEIAMVASVTQFTGVTSFSKTDPLTVGTGGQGTGSMGTKYFARVTTASAGNDVTLAATGGAVNARPLVLANDSTAAIDVFPASGQAIGDNGTNNSISLAANSILICYALTNWFCAETAFE
jgi:hypothetical protein